MVHGRDWEFPDAIKTKLGSYPMQAANYDICKYLPMIFTNSISHGFSCRVSKSISLFHILAWTRHKIVRQRTPSSELILFWGHVTRPNQGLSLSLTPYRWVGENPGNEDMLIGCSFIEQSLYTWQEELLTNNVQAKSCLFTGQVDVHHMPFTYLSLNPDSPDNNLSGKRILAITNLET